MLTVIQKIRLKILIQEYELTGHAQDERANDNLDMADVEESILNGKITNRFTNDPRGIRYETSEKVILLDNLLCHPQTCLGVAHNGFPSMKAT